MRRIAEITAFFGLSAALHAGILTQLPGAGGVEGQGSGGVDRVTLTAAPDSLAALVETWDRPPEPMSEVTQPVARLQAPSVPDLQPDSAIDSLAQPQLARPPEPDSDPSAPSTPLPAPARPTLALTVNSPEIPQPDAAATERQTPDDAPDLARTPPSAPAGPMTRAAPSVDLAAPPPPPPDTSPLATAVSPRPPLRPDRPVAQPAPSAPSTAQPARSARGSGGDATQGAAAVAPAEPPSLSAADRQSLMSRWGAEILRRIERSRPRFRGTGQVVIRLSLTPGGQLAGLSVARSSGDPALDQAALSAAQRAGRFPAAPEGLTDPVYGFSLPVTFR